MNHLHRTLAANTHAHPKDITTAKIFLKNQGHYTAPEWGMTPFPDRALFDAVRAFQKSQGLRVDGVIKPGGETETAMKTKKSGQYIWRTVGDGKVRSSHADRDGKTFSWDDPPEDGHPGEAYNCRCTAEDVNSKEVDCKELKHKIDNQKIAVQEIEKEWALLNEKYDAARKIQQSLQKECKHLQKNGLGKIAIGTGAGWLTGGPGGAIRGGIEEAITSGGDVYDVCSAADNQQGKVDEFLRQRDSAEQYMQEQRALLKTLLLEFADAGCDS